MTYDEIKKEYPLGCEVRLKEQRYHQTKNTYTPVNPHGKILAVLDPSKHGPKCLLFKIEKPEGRKISRESARATLCRKLKPSYPDPNEDTRNGRVDIFEVSAILKNKREFGTLKWLTPSEVKERVDRKGEQAYVGFKQFAEVMQKQKQDTMNDRTEQLKKTLKPGMKVKLKETTEGNWKKEKGVCIHPRTDPAMKKDLGGWMEVIEKPSVDRIALKGDGGPWNWPLTMIDKVEGEEDAQNTECYRDNLLEIDRRDAKYLINRYKEEEEILSLFRSLLGYDLFDELFQEIEEEEKYVSNLCVELGAVRDDDLSIAIPTDEQNGLEVNPDFVPEIHKVGGQYVVKFKREG